MVQRARNQPRCAGSLCAYCEIVPPCCQAGGVQDWHCFTCIFRKERRCACWQLKSKAWIKQRDADMEQREQRNAQRDRAQARSHYAEIQGTLINGHININLNRKGKNE